LIINTTIAALRDQLSEYVGLMSGLVVAASDAARLLRRALASSDEAEWWYSPREWLNGPGEQWVRIRAEDLESLVVRLLYAVGALPTPWNQIQLLARFADEHSTILAGLPPSPDEDEYPLPVTPRLRLHWLVGSRPDKSLLPRELAALVDDFERRSILDLLLHRSERVNWNGEVPLRNLFDLRDLGGALRAGVTDAPLIDQRFIDYLHAQPEDISRMHWRQFEYLVGEFFRRSGYEVLVTPPGGDGGVDVHAVRADGAIGPELVLIQMKRYGDNREVGIEAVKALWADVDEAAATRGIVATTSTLAAGAKAYCEARHYRLSAAERPMVEKWLSTLATYPR
jgi:hypothetical protein